MPYIRTQRTILPHLLLVFLLGFLFIFSFYAGLPADFSADYPQGIESCNSLTYSQFMRLALNPLTPAWFYPPQSSEMGYLRPLQFLILKGFYNFFGLGLFSIQVAEAIGFGFLSMVLFSLIYGATQSLLFGWLGVALYASFPSNFVLNLSVFSTDFQYYTSMLSISSLALFGLLTFLNRRSKKFMCLVFLSWIFTTWLAIKMKSSEKILPFVCFGFLFLRRRFIFSRIGPLRGAAIILALLGMGLLVVPIRSFNEWREGARVPSTKITVEPATQKDQATLSYSLKNMLERTFYVPGGSFPDSLTENYGFFLGGLFWLGFLLLPMVLSRMHESREALRHGLIIVAVWFASVVLGFGSGLNVHDQRFLNFGYVPSLLLLFGMTGVVEQRFIGEGGRRRVFRAVLAVLVIYTCLTNFVFFVKLVGHFGGIQDALVRAEKDIFRSFYSREPDDLTLYQRHLELESQAVLVDWYDLPGDWFERAQEKLRRENRIFFYTRRLDSERLERFRDTGYEVTPWKRYDFLDAKPLFFRFSKLIASNFSGVIRQRSPFGGGKRREIIVYLVRARPTQSVNDG